MIYPCRQGLAPARAHGRWRPYHQPSLWTLLACLGIESSALAAPIPKALLGDANLYQLTVRELEDRLTRSERFTALPQNVAGVFCAEAGTPLFFVANEGRQEPPSDKPGDYIQNRDSFRVVRSGTLLGASSDEVVLIGARELSAPGPLSVAMREVAVVGKTAVRHLRSPAYLPVTKAFLTASGWGFVSSRGVLLHNTTNLAEVDLQTKNHPAITLEGQNEYAILTRPMGFAAGEKEGRLLVTTQDHQGTNQTELAETQTQALSCQGVVRLRDGRWFSIGTRIIPLMPQQPAAPPEQLLAAVLKAVQSGNPSALSNALESATAYSPEHLRGLVQLLQTAPDPFANARNLESAARESLRTAPGWKPPEGISPDQKTQALAAMADHLKDLERFLAEVEHIRSATLGISPQMMASLIQGGYQHFSGWWLGPPRLLHQQSLGSVLMDCTYLSQSNSVHHGIFQLDETGHMQLLGDYGSALDAARRTNPLPDDRLDLGFSPPSITRWREDVTPVRKPCEFAGPDGAGILLFFPFQGLARVASGTFEWVDRSEPFRRMERLAGVDSAGRIYLVSAPAVMSGARTGGLSPFGATFSPWAYPAIIGGKGGDLWVYRRAAAAPTTPLRALFPVVSLPVMDSDQRVWFLPLKPSPATPWPRGPGALGDTLAAETAMKILLPGLVPSAAPKPPTSVFPNDLGALGWTTDLCCYDAGKITTGTTNVPFQTILKAGKDGSLVGYSWTPKVSKAFLLDKSGLTWGDNLHALAQNVPGRLLEAAPPLARPSSVFVPNYDFSPQAEHPAIARTGDLLWINQGDRVEVYRDGKPLGLQERLTLLNCPAKPILQGPVNISGSPAMLIFGQATSPSRGGRSSFVYWAVPTNNTLELLRGPEKDIDPVCEVPLINPAKGRLYLPRFVSPISFWMVSAPDHTEERSGRGVPIWVNRNGDLLTARNEQGYAGWRLEADDFQRDFPIAYARKLRVLHETQDGRLLCQSPEGVLWLRLTEADDYVADGEIPLQTGGFVLSFVGETGRELFLTLVDARQNAYLAILNKP